jgi:hypothetical protein
MRIGLRNATGLLALLLAAPVAGGELDTAMIERATGAKGTWNDKERVFKVSLLRTDLAVRVGGVKVTSPMGLTSWAAFQDTPAGTIVMGDLVLREDQVNPVLDAALQNGLEVTALHNHFLGESPRIMFMHIAGMGDSAKLAAGVGKALDRVREKAVEDRRNVLGEIDPARTTLDPKRIEAILGARGDLKDGVYKVVIAKPTHMHGTEMGAAMGVNTWAAFAGTDARAVVDGDFAMREPELQGVLKALRGAGIDIVAIHSHMTGEDPRIVFLHYWSIGTTEGLAKGLRAALDTQMP